MAVKERLQGLYTPGIGGRVGLRCTVGAGYSPFFIIIFFSSFPFWGQLPFAVQTDVPLLPPVCLATQEQL